MSSSSQIAPLAELYADSAPSEVCRCTHEVQFYETDKFLIQAVADFVRPTLNAGGSAILLATEAHRGPILAELDRAGVPSHVILNRCFAFDAEEFLASFMGGGRPDRERFHAAIGQLTEKAKPAARNSELSPAAFGEMVAVLWGRGEREAAVHLEQLWNDFCRDNALALLCAYPLNDFSSENDRAFFSAICAEHSAVMPTEDFAALIPENEKARKIAQLQQQAKVLKSEIQARAAAEEELRRSHANLERGVEERTQALRRLSLQLLKLQDSERRRIARELHDSLGQDFVGLRMNLDLARRSPHRAELWEQCDRVLDHCINEVRTLSYLLHPPMIEEVGFLPAAEWYVQDFTRRSGTRVTLEIGDNVGRPPAAAQLVLFRILQESLVNMHRHARATSGCVRIRRSDDNVVLEVSDNGVGIPPDKLAQFNRNGGGMGVGLTGTWERVRDLGGSVELENLTPGALIRVFVPFQRKRKKMDASTQASSISKAATDAGGNS